MKILVLIFFGGGLGSLLRYAVNRWLTGVVTSVFPYGTFLVNITGCFLIGFIVFYTERFGNNAIHWRLFLVTGLCGGYTTFSSFSLENSQLLSDHRLFLFLIYAASSVVLGLLATYLGILAGKSL